VRTGWRSRLASGTERRALAGRPGLLLAAAGGGLAALAHPPFGVLPGLLGFALALHALDAAPAHRPWRSAFARGWAAGFAYFLVGLWWVAEAFFVDAETYGWMAPFAVVLLPAGLALFWGAAALAYRRLAPESPRRVLVFAALFALAEWLRGHVLTGFPWDLPGEAWKAGSAPSQAAAFLGAYGLSVVTLAIAAAPAALLGPGSRLGKGLAVGAAVLTLAGLWAQGAARLASARPETTNLMVRVVQPDIPQSLKWSPEAFRAIVERHAALTAAPAARRPDVVVWSEAAIPTPIEYVLAPETWTRDRVLGSLKPGQTLLAGVVRQEGPLYYNSLLALRRTEAGFTPLALYDKHRLVPFGEFLPLSELLGRVGFKKLVAVESEFAAGGAPAPIAPEGLPPLQPLICYESLFPGFAAGSGVRPAWIVNVSNDAWFGRTSGPLQHLNIASYRAIEEGLPMVRATPTGVSAFIDPWGRTLAALPRAADGSEGAVLDHALPAPAPPTFYSRWRDLPFWALTLAGLACALGRRRR